MDCAAAKLKKQLFWRAIPLVLLDCIVNSLFGEPVFQLKGGNGQSVDEHGQVKGQLGFIAAVAELAGDAEDVLFKEFPGFRVPDQ
jgi:hypothetical protein